MFRAGSNKRSSSPKLKKIRNRKVTANNANDINVVIVPEATPKPQSRIAALLQTIDQHAPSANVYLWEWPWLPGANQNVYNSLHDSGQRFFEKLQLLFDYKEGVQPLVLACYGFGGIVVKEALNALHRQKSTKPNQLLRLSQYGIVFVGVPHPSKGPRDPWSKIGPLLNALGVFKRKNLEDEDVATIVNICLEFEKNIHPPIFTFYEELPTKIGLIEKIGLRKKSHPLLGADLAETQITDSKEWSVKTDYRGLCKHRFRSDMDEKLSCLLQHATSASIVGNLDALTFTLTVPTKQRLWDSTNSGTKLISAKVSTYTNTAGPQTLVGNSYWRTHNFMPDLNMERTPDLPCYERQSHLPNPNFVGRSDIFDKLNKFLLPSKSGPLRLRVCALSGLGGIGKTQIGLQYSFYAETEFDAIFWIPADEDIKIAQAFRNFAEKLGLAKGAELKDSTTCRKLFMNWLSNPQRKGSMHGNSNHSIANLASWLIIFDGANNIDLLGGNWPKASSGSILVTTRDATAAKKLHCDHLALKSMSERECTMLLNKLVHDGDDETFKAALAQNVSTEAEEAAADRLVQEVGCLPLAISHYAAIIRKEKTTIGQFIKKDSKMELRHKLINFKYLDSDPEEHYKQTLKTVWNLEKFTPQAMTLMSVLVFMDSEDIPDDVLTQKLTGTEYSMSEGRYEALREELTKASIITRSEKTKTISWHSLVRDVVEETLNCGVHFQSAIQLLKSSWPPKEDIFNTEKVRLTQCDRLIPHIRSIVKHLEVEKPPDVHDSFAKDLASLLKDAAWYLTQLAEYGPVLPMLEKAMNICKSHGLKEVQAETAFAFARYGEVTNMEPNQIFDYCKQFHDLAKQLDEDSQDGIEHVATSHTSLAQGYLLMDEPGEALKHCMQCIDLEKHLDDVKEGKAMSQYALIFAAWAYLGLEDYKAATICLTKVIDFRRNKYGEDDRDSTKLGLALQCLGIVRMQQGNFDDETVRLLDKALANFSYILGPDSFRVGQIHLKLAELHQLKESNQAAKISYGQAAEIFRQSDFYKPELARCLYKDYEFQNSIHTVLDPEGNDSYKEAISLYQELVPNHHLGSDRDFNQIVRFWSR